MTFVVVFLVNAGLSFALSLVVAHLVGPDAFGRYALALSISVVVNTALFEWLRLSTTRFYSERVRREEPHVGSTLDAAYLVTGAAVTLVSGLLLLGGVDLGMPAPLLASAVAVGLSVGFFDYRTAQARARFLDRRYAALLFSRGLAAFALASAAAWIWADPVYVLVGSASAALLTPLLLPDRSDRATPGRPRPDLLLVFARYALPLVAASAIYQLLPLLNRAVLASRSGYAEAGYFSLASEIAVRLFQNLGAALDLALFQLAVRAEEQHGPAEAARQVRRNLGLIAAIVIPSAVGLWVVWPSFEAIFVPPAFRGQVAVPMALSTAAFAAYALVQYALNPVFQLRRRTAAVIAAALVALALNAALLFAWPGLTGAAEVAAVQFASFGVACIVLTALAARTGAGLPWRDLAGAVAASAVMAAALWPWREALPPLPGLLVQAIVGAALYGGLALFLDLAGSRARVAALLQRISGAAPARNR